MKRIEIGMAVLLAMGIAGFPSRIEAQGTPAGRRATAAGKVYDAKALDGLRRLGDANWRLVGDYVEANSGMGGFLVLPDTYTNFHLTAEFWTDPDANSGIFIRCEDPNKIGAETAYEVNIFDKRPDPQYRTGAIVNVASPKAKIDAANKWNTYDITAEGSHFVVKLNGTLTVDTMDTKHPSGCIGLQYGAGIVRFRNVKIEPR